MSRYIDDVANGKKVNNQIIYNIQTIVNKLPNLNLSKLVQSFMVKTKREKKEKKEKKKQRRKRRQRRKKAEADKEAENDQWKRQRIQN